MHEEWEEFVTKNSDFQAACGQLYSLVLQLVCDAQVAPDDTTGAVIIELMQCSVMDFDDILLLSSHNRHWGALKLLRGLYERTVTMKYLASNPEKTEDFLASDAIDWDVVLKGIEKVSGLRAKEGTVTKVGEAAAKARKRLRQEKCPECGLRKQTSWTPMSSLQLAEKTGLSHLHFFGFVLPSKHIHPTYFGAREVTDAKAAPIQNTLKTAHEVMLETVILHQRHFTGDPLTLGVVQEVVQRFFRIWVFSESDFGLGEDCERAGIMFRPHATTDL